MQKAQASLELAHFGMFLQRADAKKLTEGSDIFDRKVLFFKGYVCLPKPTSTALYQKYYTAINHTFVDVSFGVQHILRRMMHCNKA
ncbi:hypothetical protein [Massilia sp. X63]|uniref:hypothetical protein n=1 Tax=Massilia sp. X63 TaxID=3237285 RepID=UPI0034DDBED9